MLISAISLMGVMFSSSTGFSQPPQFAVQLSTDPPDRQLLPFEAEAATLQSPVRLTLKAINSTDQPLKNAKIQMKILTPPRNPWLTTDFPMVEGTELLEIEALAPMGELQIEQMFPIRGEYQLVVEVTPVDANGFTPFQQTLALPVQESWVKYRNFGILAAVLLAVGFGGGLVIGAQQKIRSGEIAPQQVRLLLSGAIGLAIIALLFVNLNAEMAQSDMSMSHMTKSTPLTDKPNRMQSQGLELRISGDTSAIVGNLAQFQATAFDTKTDQSAKDIVLNIKATQLENNWVSFAHQGVPDAMGQLTWQQQFFDGAPHKIEVEVAPAPNSNRKFQPFRVAQTIKVEGIAPPLLVRLISLTYFVGFVVVGLLFGLWFWRKQKLSINQA